MTSLTFDQCRTIGDEGVEHFCYEIRLRGYDLSSVGIEHQVTGRQLDFLHLRGYSFPGPDVIVTGVRLFPGLSYGEPVAMAVDIKNTSHPNPSDPAQTMWPVAPKCFTALKAYRELHGVPAYFGFTDLRHRKIWFATPEEAEMASVASPYGDGSLLVLPRGLRSIDLMLGPLP